MAASAPLTQGLVRSLLLAAALAVVALGAGFGWFAAVAGQPGAPPPASDGIVVLTGGAGRVELALRLAGRMDPGEPAGTGGSAEASGAGGVRERGMARMSQAGGHIRSLPAVRSALAATREELRRFAATRRAKDPADLVEAFIDRDVLLTQFAYLSAIEAYISHGGPSRGGYLVQSAAPTEWQPDAEVGATRLQLAADGTPSCEHEWVPVRPIPQEDDWFENVWRAYREGGVWL